MSPKIRRKVRIPNEIIALPNPDKTFHEKWYKGRNALNLPHPFRGICLGPPNCGKGTVVKNIVLRAKPAFEEIVCIHCDPDFTSEWDDINVKMLAEIPAPDEWEGAVKTLVILDDLDFTRLNKDQQRNLNRLFGFVSTHKHISCLLCSQDAFNVPACVRRCSNLFIMWRCPDLDAMATCARKTGLKSQNFNAIFEQLDMKDHDSLWLDMTSRSPYPMRKNGYELIKKDDGKETQKNRDNLDKFSV